MDGAASYRKTGSVTRLTSHYCQLNDHPEGRGGESAQMIACAVRLRETRLSHCIIGAIMSCFGGNCTSATRNFSRFGSARGHLFPRAVIDEGISAEQETNPDVLSVKS